LFSGTKEWKRLAIFASPVEKITANKQKNKKKKKKNVGRTV
jgi:hypothetical protein